MLSGVIGLLIVLQSVWSDHELLVSRPDPVGFHEEVWVETFPIEDIDHNRYGNFHEDIDFIDEIHTPANHEVIHTPTIRDVIHTPATHRETHCDPYSNPVARCPNGDKCSIKTMKCVEDHEFIGTYRYCICPHRQSSQDGHHEVSHKHHEVESDDELEGHHVGRHGLLCNPHDVLSFCPNGVHCDPNNLSCEPYLYAGQVLYGRYQYCRCPKFIDTPIVEEIDAHITKGPVHCDPYSYDPHQVCPSGEICSTHHLDCVVDPIHHHRYIYCKCRPKVQQDYNEPNHGELHEEILIHTPIEDFEEILIHTPVEDIDNRNTKKSVHCDPNANNPHQHCPDGHICSTDNLHCEIDPINRHRYLFCECQPVSHDDNEPEVWIDHTEVHDHDDEPEIWIDTDIFVDHTAKEHVHCDPYAHNSHQYCPDGHICSTHHSHCEVDPINRHRYLYCECHPEVHHDNNEPEIWIDTDVHVHCDPYANNPHQPCPDDHMCSTIHLHCEIDPINHNRYLHCTCRPKDDTVDPIQPATGPVHCDPYSRPHQHCPGGERCSTADMNCVADPIDTRRYQYCECPEYSKDSHPYPAVPEMTSDEVHCNPYPDSPNQICPSGDVCSTNTMDCVQDPENHHRLLYCICP